MKTRTSNSVEDFRQLDEMLPSIEAAKKIAKLVDTTVGYLLEETEQADLFKDPLMLQRLNDINDLPEDDKRCILYTLDNLIQNVKAKKAFAVK